MKKIFFMVGVICIVAMPAVACDICGCGAGTAYVGILPDFRKRFIGLRYQQNSLYAHLGINGASTYLTNLETYRSMELWGATKLGDKFRLAGFIPVNFLQRSNAEGNVSQHGLGDITAIGYYQVLDKKKTIGNSKLLAQSLWVGAGLKLPTGKYDPEEESVEESMQNSFQQGTGSLDYSMHVAYDLRLQDAGINVNTSYRINSRNKYDYRYGNKFTLNALLYYKWRLLKKISIAPNTGLLFESAARDAPAKEIKAFATGGRIMMGTIGLELSWKRLSTGANLQSPLSQQLGAGKIKARERGMAYISYSF